jgi:outer membrane protein assembly factor BamB
VSGRGLVHVSDDRGAYGLDVGTGARRWRADVVPASIPAAAPARVGAVSSDETRVYVPWFGIPDDGGLVVLDAATGQVATNARPFIGPRSTTLRSPWRVTVASGFIEGTLAGTTVSIDGPTPWTLLTDLGGDQPLRPPTPAAVTADRFFVGLATGFYGANMLNSWRLDRGCTLANPELCQPDSRTQLDGVPGEAVVADGEATVYVATEAGTVYAVDSASGAVRWTAALGSPVTQRLAWTPSALYAVTAAGRLVTLDPDGCGHPTCTPVASVPLSGGAPVAAPAVAGGVVYVASAGGTIDAFVARGGTASTSGAGGAGGRPLWTTILGTEITGGPTIALGALLVGTADGHVIAFRPSPAPP